MLMHTWVQLVEWPPGYLGFCRQLHINTGSSLAIVTLLFDSMIFSPLTISGYFTCRSILEGSGWQGVREKLSTRLVSTVKGAWRFWPLVNVINYGLVPLQFRVLYSDILSLFWTGYLTFVNSKKISRTWWTRMAVDCVSGQSDTGQGSVKDTVDDIIVCGYWLGSGLP